MKLNDAIALGAQGCWTSAQVRCNPGKRGEWFIMLYNSQLQSFILADNDDNPITSEEISALAQRIKMLGLSEFTVHL